MAEADDSRMERVVREAVRGGFASLAPAQGQEYRRRCFHRHVIGGGQ